MEPIVDRSPQQIKQYERRPETVDSLFSATMLGVNDYLPKSVASTKATDISQPWDSVYSQATQSLRQERDKTSNPLEQARLDFLQNQLRDLNQANPAERTKILHGLKVNDTTMQQLEGNFYDVKRMLGSAQFSSAIDKQKESVTFADKLDRRALSEELTSIRDTIKTSTKPEIRAQLSHDVESTLSVMGASFTERVRLASLQLRSNSDYQAERTLDSALKVNLPAEVWTIPSMAQLRADATRVKDDLFVKHNLLPLFDRYGSRLSAVSGREDIKLDELKRLPGNEKEFVNFKRFLIDNYDKLTAGHPFYKFSYGITRDDLQEYSTQQSRKINDLVN